MQSTDLVMPSWGQVARASALPWATIERQRRAVAQHRAEQIGHWTLAHREIALIAELRAALPVDGYMRDSDLRALAERRAEIMGQRLAGMPAGMTPEAVLAWTNEQIQPLQGRSFAFAGEIPKPRQVEGMLMRVQCPAWWRRQLRRAAIQAREREGIERHEVCATRKQPYCTTDAVKRRVEQLARNAAILERTELQNEDGDVFTLAQLAAVSTSNKGIRRGELMTRIKGCEVWAEQHDMAGVFLTMTAPSRFHPTTRHGRPNPKHDGSTPRDAQRWLCNTFAKARARVQREGISFFGFRVAEPHHDGCPHWHLLLWVAPEQMGDLCRDLRRWLLLDAGDEKGASQHRFKAVVMNKGGACAYVAKYISKNIDDTGAVHTDGHIETEFDGVDSPKQIDCFGGTAQRVEAWAAAWGIRQFQALGQPPVTVWRELRRVKAGMTEGSTDAVRDAWAAAQRKGETRADWCSYMSAQGGAMVGRCYRVRLATLTELRHGRYETTERARPVGVCDSTRPGELICSERKEWRTPEHWLRPAPVVTLAALPPMYLIEDGRFVANPAFEQAKRAARSPVNNCTHRENKGLQPDALIGESVQEGSVGEEEKERCPAPGTATRCRTRRRGISQVASIASAANHARTLDQAQPAR